LEFSASVGFIHKEFNVQSIRFYVHVI